MIYLTYIDVLSMIRVSVICHAVNEVLVLGTFFLQILKLLFTVIAYILLLCCSYRDSEGLYGTLCIVILVYYKLVFI